LQDGETLANISVGILDTPIAIWDFVFPRSHEIADALSWSTTGTCLHVAQSGARAGKLFSTD